MDVVFMDGEKPKEDQKSDIFKRIAALPMNTYERNGVKYECIQVKERVPVQDKSFLFKWTRAFDWIVFPLDAEGKRLVPHICQVGLFERTFTEVVEKAKVEKVEEAPKPKPNKPKPSARSTKKVK